MQSKYINAMPTGERDYEDGGNRKAPSTYDVTLRIREAWAQKTARRRQQLRTDADKVFFAANHRAMLNSERDRMLDSVNKQIAAEFGPEPKVRM